MKKMTKSVPGEPVPGEPAVGRAAWGSSDRDAPDANETPRPGDTVVVEASRSSAPPTSATTCIASSEATPSEGWRSSGSAPAWIALLGWKRSYTPVAAGRGAPRQGVAR